MHGWNTTDVSPLLDCNQAIGAFGITQLSTKLTYVGHPCLDLRGKGQRLRRDLER